MESSHPVMVSGFLPSASLVEALIQISNEVVSQDKLPCLQTRNHSSMVRRMKLLSSLFEEIRECKNPLPPSSVLCFTELFSTIRRAKLLMQDFRSRPVLWNLIQTEFAAKQFHLLVKDMGNALDILPLSLLDIPLDIQEQVELLHGQVKKADVFVDPRDCQRREELFQVMARRSAEAGIQCKKTEMMFWELGLRSPSDYQEEIWRLEAEVAKQAGTGGLVVVSNINNLISLVEYYKSVLFVDDRTKVIKQENQWKEEQGLAPQTIAQNIPDEFRCPITLHLMRDPVIISSGHTYDRSAITQWINSGHHSCPKSGRKLIHMALIPNFALRSLVSQWCQENNVTLSASSSTSPCSSHSEIEKCEGRASVNRAADHILATKSAVDDVKMTADFLVGKLATGSTEIRRQAAFELRILAKIGMVNRRMIAEAGAIPFLVTLLGADDSRTQENAVTALLNLSIFDNNKLLIMEAGAVDGIIEVLQKGKSMEARENAAATIFSLSMIDECKITIGAHATAIPGLVGLLREGTSPGKKDAAMALFNLVLHHANRERAVVAGVIPLLIDLLMDDKAGITDDALAVLSLLSGCPEGLAELRESSALVPVLVDLLKFGSPKGKDNSVHVLLGMCRSSEDIAKRLSPNQRCISLLQGLVLDGSTKSRRKADALLRVINRYSYSHSSPLKEP